MAAILQASANHRLLRVPSIPEKKNFGGSEKKDYHCVPGVGVSPILPVYLKGASNL
jgi:hypothetical protein